jgi:hypothetical protein
MSRYRFIEAQRSQYPVRLLCQVVAVPASGYYAWQQTQEQVGSEKEPAWEEALSRSSADTSAATARAGYRSLCAARATVSGASACAGPCVAGACTRCNPSVRFPLKRVS